MVESWATDLANRLTSVSSSERESVLFEYEELTGKSRSSLYRIARKAGFVSGRKKRADAGTLKSGLTDKQIEFVVGLIHETGRELKGPIMPVWRALQIAEDNSIITKGTISVERLTAILSERGLSKKNLVAPDSHISLRSLHPNHVHLVDVSICIQYYLREGDGNKLGVMRASEFNKNKPDNFVKLKGTRIMRYVLVDHFSGAIFWYYYSAKGETQNNLYDFLLRSWAHKEDDRYPFRGVPFKLLMDAGSANTAKAMVSMLDQLDVEVPKGKPHNPRRQGAVEVAHNIVEKCFESGLRIQPAHDIESLNSWAKDYATWFNYTRQHSRHKQTRSACWLKIKPEELRELPPVEMMQELFASPIKDCTVDGEYCISFRGQRYRLKHVPELFRGAKVQAVLKPLEWPDIAVDYKGQRYQAKPDEIMEGGFSAHAAIIDEEFKSSPETFIQKTKKEIEAEVYGDEGKQKDSIPYEGLNVFGNHSEKIGNVAFIPKRGHELELRNEVLETQVPVMELLKRVAHDAGEIPPFVNRMIRSECGDKVGSGDIEELSSRYVAIIKSTQAQDNDRMEAINE